MYFVFFLEGREKKWLILKFPLFPIKLKKSFLVSHFFQFLCFHFSETFKSIHASFIHHYFNSFKMNCLIFTSFFVLIGLIYGSSNSCINFNLQQGYSFSESVAKCQSKVTSHLKIFTTTNIPSVKTQSPTHKAIPPRFFNPAISSTKSPIGKVKSYLPYLLATSAILSLTAILSKFPFSYFLCNRFFFSIIQLIF